MFSMIHRSSGVCGIASAVAARVVEVELCEKTVHNAGISVKKVVL